LTGLDWLGLGLTHHEGHEGLSAAGPQPNDDLTTDGADITDKFVSIRGIGEIRGGESPRRCVKWTDCSAKRVFFPLFTPQASRVGDADGAMSKNIGFRLRS
jgi:hypothetical protein